MKEAIPNHLLKMRFANHAPMRPVEFSTRTWGMEFMIFPPESTTLWSAFPEKSPCRLLNDFVAKMPQNDGRYCRQKTGLSKDQRSGTIEGMIL